MKKKDKNVSKNLIASAAIYALSIAATIYLFTVDDGKRNWFEYLTGIVIPSLVLLYVAYLFRPRNDILRIVLYALITLSGVAITGFIVGYILTIIAIGIQ